jgi:hypothetical protein
MTKVGFAMQRFARELRRSDGLSAESLAETQFLANNDRPGVHARIQDLPRIARQNRCSCSSLARIRQ